MSDPVAQITLLLEPVATFTKLVTASGSWSLRREEVERPFFCAVLEGSLRLAVPGLAPVTVAAGDFILLPLARSFGLSSQDRSPDDPRTSVPVQTEPGTVRLGDPLGASDTRYLIGYGKFGAEDAHFLAALLPPMLHVREEPRLLTLVRLIDDEARADRPARTEVLTSLLGLVLIETLRSTSGGTAPAGLLRGLTDARLAPALRAMHADPAKQWTVLQLATAAGLSRTAFFDRFSRQLGMAPMQYLLQWRMLLAKRLLKEAPASVVARRVGYASTSTFSTAFSRHIGLSPSHFLRLCAPIGQAE